MALIGPQAHSKNTSSVSAFFAASRATNGPIRLCIPTEQAPISIRTHLVQNAIARRFVQFSALFLALYIATSSLIAIFVTEATLHVVRRPVRHRANFEAIVKENYHSIVQDVIVEAKDGATLKGWYVQPKDWNRTFVILLHGVTDNREGVVGFSRMFLSAGYAVLLRKLRRVYVPLLLNLHSATFREIAYDRVSQMTGLGPTFSRTLARPTLELAILYSRLRYGVNLTEADPQAALAASKVPALLIDDQADRNIPLRHSPDIMRTAGQQSQLWEVQGAAHGELAACLERNFSRGF
jgi:hypothetical protein